ncbi:MAG: 2-succinyl-6-hydroxy-2,4-cyclohexadiene-1-carboxylate synthase [Dehalococcoidia bacterium]|nr:2-succinyl-6-hydroxy-2,4-cyclohexadiene-1-carboxylate synthase [Dehalococcoidia bacterium]HCV00766.1 2-succinyl-6-hydroxy-2,4-cyclohexadiene-1-carboxylate synthase [Dehalococcoidia bacterium]
MTQVSLQDGLFLNVERWGSGPPIVLLHGFTGSAMSWGPLAEMLAARFTVLAVDVVGHGSSSKPLELDRYAIDQAAQDVVAAINALGFRRSSWLGYSMGGRLALFVAAMLPQAVDRLILIGASPGIVDEEERATRRAADEALADRIEREGVSAFVDYWESLPIFASQARLPEGMRRAITRGRLANDAHGLSRSLQGMGTGAQLPLHNRLSGIQVRSLLLAGSLDSKFSAIANQMVVTMPNSRAVHVPGAGHAPHIEKPAYCARTITAFLKEGMRENEHGGSLGARR